jgi:phosphoribosylformimino-5-aminoimidazole carboxamide ribotide isomerase
MIAKDYPAIEVVAGGGVAGVGDLVAISRAGASAVLVASAFHDGRLRREDLDRFAQMILSGAGANPDHRSHASVNE